MKSLNIAKVSIIILFILINSCKDNFNSERPLEPTLPLPNVTIDNNRYEKWSDTEPLWNSIRAWHYNPEMVQPLTDLGKALNRASLSNRIKLMLVIVTDSRNGCIYCLSNAICLSLEIGLSKKEILELQTDIKNSNFTDKEKALLTLAEQITLQPSTAHKSIGPAIDAGWSNDDVAQAIFIVSYYNMLNRISEAFALPPDKGHRFNPNFTLPMTDCE